MSKNSKFGVVDSDFGEVLSTLSSSPLVTVVGLHCHLGSTISDVSVFAKLFSALDRVISSHSLLSSVRIVNMMDAGAYCMAMTSNYNLRPRPAEVLVDGDKVTVVRERESYRDVVGYRG